MVIETEWTHVPLVVHMDNNRGAKRFFAKKNDVIAFANRHKVHSEKTERVFHGLSHEAGIPNPQVLSICQSSSTPASSRSAT